MKWQSFENKIRKTLSRHRSEVDVDALWQAIEPDVDAVNAQHRKKRRGLIWFLVFGLLLAGAGAGYYFTYTPPTNVAETIKEANETKHTTGKAGLLEKESETTQGLETEQANKPQSDKTASPAPLAPIAERKEKPFVKNKKPTQSAIVQKPIVAPHKSLFEEKPVTEPVEGESVIAEKPKENNTRHFQTPRLINPLKTAPLKLLVFENKELLNLKSATAETAENQDVENKSLTVEKAVEEPVRRQKTFRFGAGLDLGASYANRRLESIDSVNTGLLPQRKSTEKVLETVQLGFGITARHRSGLELASGLRFTRMTELFEYKNNTVEVDSIDGIQFLAVNPNNDTIPVFGLVPQVTRIDAYKKYYNRYTLLDIPLLVGYSTQKGKWSIGGQAGIFANISLKTKGRFLVEENVDGDIEPLFRSNVGLSYYAGFSVGYNLTDHLQVHLSPHARHFAGNFAKASAPISQKYTLFGLNTGIQYWF